MNYFSHYYFDEKSGDKDFNFGLVLPDFVRNFLPKQRIVTSQLQWNLPSHNSLKEGVEKHFYRDEVFHVCDYFKSKDKEVLVYLNPIFKSLGLNRTFLASHVLVELLIDRVLIKENQNRLKLFYEELIATDKSLIAEFLLLNGYSNTERFFEVLQRFLELQYLFMYLDDEKIIYSLSKVFEYVSASGAWTKEQIQTLSREINYLESCIFENISELKEQMQ